MKNAVVVALCLAGAGLGGCAVTSEQPLFAVSQAPRHPLREGLWAVTGPGCDVKPSPAGQALPECVGETMTVAGSRLDWALVGSPVGAMSAAQLKTITGSLPTSGDFVLVDGDPNILEMIVDKPPAGAPALPPPLGGGAGAAAPVVSYMSLRTLQEDPAGRVVRGVLWMTPCPDNPGQTAGFKASARPQPSTVCQAETPEAVRAQAPHMKPFLSFFVTWVR